MTALDVAMYGALFLVCGMAFWKGRRPERFVAAAFLANFAINTIQTYKAVLTQQMAAPFDPATSLVLDLALLSVLIAVALSSRPLWTLFTAAFQLLATLTSVVRLTDQDISALAYITAQNTLWWMSLAVLAYGVWEAHKYRRSEEPRPSKAAGAPQA